MRFMVLLSTLTAMFITSAALAQSGRPRGPTPPNAGSSAAQRAARTAVREQALAELDDPNRLARIAALEDILAGADSVLIDFALRKVVAGNDQEMKSIVLRHALSKPTRQFTFQIKSCAYGGSSDQNAINSTCEHVSGNLSGNITLFFDSLDVASGEFVIHSLKSDHQNGRYIATQGKVVGSNIEFYLNLLGASDARLAQCFGRLAVDASGSMAGSINCGDDIILTGDFSIL